MRYQIIIEKSENGYGAYPPDVPGIGVVGDTKEEVIELVKEAIKLYLEEKEKEPTPEQRNAETVYVEV